MREHYESQSLTRYYIGDHFYDFEAFFADIPRDTRVINFGCGRGEVLKEFPNGVGVDFNRKLRPLWDKLNIGGQCFNYSAKDIPWGKHSFDWSISVDFLEHLQPEVVGATVETILRVAPHGRHVIHTLAESGFRGPNGENLHPSARNAAQWIMQFKGASFKQRGEHLLLYW